MTRGLIEGILEAQKKCIEDNKKLLESYGIRMNEYLNKVANFSSLYVIKTCHKYGIRMDTEYGSKTAIAATSEKIEFCYKYGIDMNKKYGATIVRYFTKSMIKKMTKDINKQNEK